MAEHLRSLLDELVSAAETLDDPPTSALISALAGLRDAPKLRVAVIGSTGSGRASVVNALLDRQDILPRSPLPKAPLDITVHSGPAVTVELVRADGAREPLSSARLGPFLRGEGDDLPRYAAIDVQAPATMLQTCDLRIVALESPRAAPDWQTLLAATDFTILVLRATALLSQRERDVIREHLVGYGLQRVAIIINQMDLIPLEERDSLVDLVHLFLGPFDRQPVVLAVSAAEMPAAGSGYDELATLAADLFEQFVPRRDASLGQALAMGLDELEAGVRRATAEATLSAADIDALRSTIAARREWLAQRVKRVQNRVDAFTGALIKERLIREIEGFGALFRRRLPDDVMPIEDIAVVKQYLPGYIETVWTRFFQNQLIAVQARLADEAKAIERMIDSDLRELLDGSGDLGPIADTFDPDMATRPFVTPKRGRHRAESIAASLSFQGFFLLIFNPPRAILTLATSQLVRRFYRGDIDLAGKRAILTAASTATLELEAELRNHVETEFGRLAEEMKGEVARLYTDGVERIERFLADAAARKTATAARQEQLATLASTTLPALRRRLDAVTAEEAPV